MIPYIDKAQLCYEKNAKLPDGSIESIVIWRLPQPTKDRPHGYKYRLNYSTADGKTIVRFDNKTGKGDHVHIYEKKFSYIFKDIDTLVNDFWRAIRLYRKQKHHEKNV